MSTWYRPLLHANWMFPLSCSLFSSDVPSHHSYNHMFFLFVGSHQHTQEIYLHYYLFFFPF